ncbi:TetR/AcrR family transcriptional regulator [Baekduia soli]|uniref:TetR/AcrR family transcriptional regulator n=1 Tax=Baekduia soli TaxID=496014 RepID=UPI0016526107|nr:TetR/AcrR family transcriptional regulator [Baekduia soli]
MIDEDPEPPDVLPRGRHAASREVVAESQRRRMLVALAEVVAEKGYGATSVADVIEGARVSRRTFYEHFANKEECFLAAYDAGVQSLLHAIAASPGPTADDPERARRAAAGTYLGLLADNPAFARAFLVEVLAAGPRALQRRAAVRERFAGFLAERHLATALRTGEPQPPAHVFRAAVGAIDELVTDRLLTQGAASLPGLLDAVVDVERRLLSRAPAP